MNLTVHHLEHSRSARAIWLLEELEAPYELRRYRRNPRTFRADPALKSVSPLGRAPIVEIDGVALAESGAIMEGVLDRIGQGRLRPEPGTADFDHYRFFLHYAEGSLMPPLLISLIFSKAVEGAPFFVRPVVKGIAAGVHAKFIRGEFDAHFGFVEAHLAENEWFAGPAFSAADIQMVYPVAAAPLRAGLTKQSHPNLHRWLEQVRGRPAYQRAIDKGGPLFP
ncbi:MAG: glutathione S-transferase [Deltaproteobacteria bacterium]|nr:MAG: glutathione S-transferase [Deltaproteobacteria bacterium]